MDFQNTLVNLIIFSLADLSLQDSHSHWSYEDEAHWGGQCNEGRKQSPVNIDSRAAVVDYGGLRIKGPVVMENYANFHAEGINNGHTVQFSSVEGQPRPLLRGGPLRHPYELMQFHFHWFSEHSIDYEKYPMEIHFVHVKQGTELEDVFDADDTVTVVAVMCQVVSRYQSDGALRHLESILPSLHNRTDDPIPVGKLDLTDLLSLDTVSYFTYSGSLTTPTCDEVVTWIVLDTPILITDEQYRLFSRINVGGISNFRTLQPLNGRKVYRSPCSKSSAIVASPSSTGLVASVFGLWRQPFKIFAFLSCLAADSYSYVTNKPKVVDTI